MEYGTPIEGFSGNVQLLQSPDNMARSHAADEDNVWHLVDSSVLDYILNKVKDTPFSREKGAPRKIIVIKAGATWCRPCKESEPVFKKWASSERETNVIYCSLDIDKNDQFSHLFSAVPAYLFIDHTGRLLEDEVILGAHLPALLPIRNKVKFLQELAASSKYK